MMNIVLTAVLNIPIISQSIRLKYYPTIFSNEGKICVNKAIFATIQSQLAFSCDEIIRDPHFKC